MSPSWFVQSRKQGEDRDENERCLSFPPTLREPSDGQMDSKTHLLFAYQL